MASPTTLKVPDELRARLAAQAESEGKSAHAYMRDLERLSAFLRDTDLPVSS